jgi:hypothetical protein
MPLCEHVVEDYVVTSLAQRVDDRLCAALISHKLHTSRFVPIRRAGEKHYLFVGDARRAIGDRRAEVFLGQVRVIFEQFGLAAALREFAKD